MKKIVLCLFTIGALLFCSCNNDDDSNDPPSEVSLQGTWRLTAMYLEEDFDFNQDGTANINVLDEVNCLNNEQLIIGNDQTATFMSTSYLDIFIVLVSGTTNEYMFDIDCGQDVDSDTSIYIQNGDTYVFDYYGDLLTGSLNGNQLSLVFPSGAGIYDEDTFEIVATQDLTYVYTKQ